MSTTPKDIIFEEDARHALLTGIKKLIELVSFTLGPKGRNVCMEKSWGAPNITNDGASIMRDVILSDPFENMGAAMIIELVQKIKEICGDGTTTVAILSAALVEEGIKNVSSGASPIGIKRGIDKAVEIVVKEIEKNAIPVKTKQETSNVATVSASGNRDIGDMIADAMEKVGTSGAITIEEGKTTETTIEVVTGMKFDRGYVSHHLCTNIEKMTVEMEHPQILLVNKKISNIHELLPVLQSTAAAGSELLIIAEDFEGDVITTLVVNKLRGTLKVAAVKAPGFGDRRTAMLQDIADLTGATVISEEVGMSLNEIPPTALGSAEKIIITKDSTTITGGGGTSEQIASRIKQIDAEIELTTSSYEKEKLQERRAKLSGGVAVIKVGAASETEMKQKKQMFDDSLNSTKAALEEGIVPGGGAALLNACKALENLHLEGDEAIGAKIVLKACGMPLKQIAINTGFDGSIILNQVLKSPKNFGFNALNEQVEDLILAGVIDPAKVAKSTIRYAASTAGTILLSEVLIVDAKED
ncbi:MAG: chaperonin GroEL [Parachlamydiaceae bacterium]|nr:chaperonin GroEL [Parachlamydiaceae bacterium]